AGAKQGEVLLAVNTLMMQLFNFFSYFTDGFAYAGEALTGKYIGAEDEQMMHKSIRNIFYWGISLALIFTVLYAGYANQIMGIITDKQEA
ncbi:MAG TPA: MATE family efflux transporter, partial [Paludibacteraceae bacterium]|nr:MATE family efflux transporter [Paludibacteraceae bacterium]